MNAHRCLVVSLFLAVGMLVASPSAAFAQGKSKKGSGPTATATASITLSDAMRVEIRDYYAQYPVTSVEALPPGIRMRLARGKPLPPGIAKKVAPGGLHARLGLPEGYRVFEVGMDVLLVEVATNVVHDILMDAIR